MATTENEYYLRSILLLAEGGSYISKMVLDRELSGDLDTLLKSFKSKLKHELHDKQMEKLFPGHGMTAVDTWDLQMLIIVVLRLFHNSLKQEDKNNLRVIKMLRHDVQAHNPSATLDDVQYDNIKGQLTDALTSLASGCDDDVQKECRSYITKYASGPLDVMSARECLKQLQENDAMFKQVLEKVEKSNNSICAVSQQITDLEKTLMERLERLDKGTCRKKIKVGMHVELALDGPTEEWILLMERTLNDIFNEAYKTSGGKFADMKKTVEELLDDIKQNTTIKFNGSKTKCIILMFECSTFTGLTKFLQYVTSQRYRDRLDALTKALSAHFRVDSQVTVTSKITPACLQNAIDILDTTVEHDEKRQENEICQSHPSDENKKSLRLSMECSSAEDLVYLWKMFQQGGAAHYLDRIADMLSEHSGQRIKLSSSIDLEEFKEALEDTVGSAVHIDRGTSKTTEDSMKDIHRKVEDKCDVDHLRVVRTKAPLFLSSSKSVDLHPEKGKTTVKHKDKYQKGKRITLGPSVTVNGISDELDIGSSGVKSGSSDGYAGYFRRRSTGQRRESTGSIKDIRTDKEETNDEENYDNMASYLLRNSVGLADAGDFQLHPPVFRNPILESMKDVEENSDAEHFQLHQIPPLLPKYKEETNDVENLEETAISLLRKVTMEDIRTDKAEISDVENWDETDTYFLRTGSTVDVDRGIGKTTVGDAIDVGKTFICYDYQDKAGQKPFERLAELTQPESAFEGIQKVFVYKSPLTPLWFLNFWLYHMVIVFETQTWWWSIEKSSDGITIQRSKTSKDLLKQYRYTSRKYGNTLEKSTKGYSSVAELIHWLNKTGELERDYNIMTSNCTTFANVVLDYVTVPRSPQAKTTDMQTMICRQMTYLYDQLI